MSRTSASELTVMIQYFRRFRMEFNFAETNLPQPQLPAGFEFIGWQPQDVERHAVAKFRSFREGLDLQLFPCLSTLEGCRKLMGEIAGQPSFMPSATWLVSRLPDRRGFCEDCGTVQGLGSSGEAGFIQNIGVIADCRGLGIGRALILKSLHGFRTRGTRRVYLEATAENVPAIELYRSLGFRLIRTNYREVPTTSAIAKSG